MTKQTKVVLKDADKMKLWQWLKDQHAAGATMTVDKAASEAGKVLEREVSPVTVIKAVRLLDIPSLIVRSGRKKSRVSKATRFNHTLTQQLIGFVDLMVATLGDLELNREFNKKFRRAESGVGYAMNHEEEPDNAGTGK